MARGGDEGITRSSRATETSSLKGLGQGLTPWLRAPASAGGRRACRFRARAHSDLQEIDVSDTLSHSETAGRGPRRAPRHAPRLRPRPGGRLPLGAGRRAARDEPCLLQRVRAGLAAFTPRRGCATSTRRRPSCSPASRSPVAARSHLPVRADEIDVPDHIKYRRIVNPWFSPRAIDAAELAMRALRRRLVEETAPAGGCDFVTGFALRYPTEAFRVRHRSGRRRPVRPLGGGLLRRSSAATPPAWSQWPRRSRASASTGSPRWRRPERPGAARGRPRLAPAAPTFGRPAPHRFRAAGHADGAGARGGWIPRAGPWATCSSISRSIRSTASGLSRSRS